MDIRDILQKLDKVQNPKELTSEIVKSNLNESAAISVNMYGNNPDEVQALYNIFKNAGLQAPMPAPMRCERQRLFSGRSDKSGRCPSRVCIT